MAVALKHVRCSSLSLLDTGFRSSCISYDYFAYDHSRLQNGLDERFPDLFSRLRELNENVPFRQPKQKSKQTEKFVKFFVTLKSERNSSILPQISIYW